MPQQEGIEMSWKTLREVIGDALILAYSAFTLWIFYFIWRYGAFTIWENNMYIRIFETIAAVVIGITGLYLGFEDFTRKAVKKWRKK